MKSKKAAAIMLCAVLGTSMITGVSVSAKDKDELVLYTWEGMFPQEVLDDFEKDRKSGTYNPFVQLYGAELSESVRRAIADTMKNELVAIGNAFDLMDFEDTDIRTLLYHIVFEGMHKTTEDLANKKKKGETH